MKTKKGINELLKTCGMIVFQIFQIWKELKESQVEIERLKQRIDKIAKESADPVLRLDLQDGGGECVIKFSDCETISSANGGSFITMKSGTIFRVLQTPEFIASALCIDKGGEM